MAIHAITGGATGIGAALREQLSAEGHRVISVDIRQGDVVADLATAEGRAAAVAGVCTLAPEGLDGLIPCAGLPPVAQPRERIASVNYFAVVAIVEGLRELVARRRGSVLIVSSNSAPMVAAEDPCVQACLGGDEAEAWASLAGRDGTTAYAGSKRAITQWMRRNAVDYARSGVRMNAVAPGITRTPLSDQVFADEALGQSMRDFQASVPWGGMAEPAQIANVMRFLLSAEAGFICGATVFVDGGSDAMLRPDQF